MLYVRIMCARNITANINTLTHTHTRHHHICYMCSCKTLTMRQLMFAPTAEWRRGNASGTITITHHKNKALHFVTM